METTKLGDAVAEYLGRKERSRHPHGTFDNAGRWYPIPSEQCACCNYVRSPSRAYPYSLMTHCRTIEHVANLYDVSASDLRRAVRAASVKTTPRREGGESYYKAVALVDGRYLSIYDGETEYRLGETLAQTARRDHMGGFYVYDDASAAANADVPRGSMLYDAPRVVLRVRAEGAYVRYQSGDHDKLAFSRITPIEVVMLPEQVERGRGRDWAEVAA